MDLACDSISDVKCSFGVCLCSKVRWSCSGQYGPTKLLRGVWYGEGRVSAGVEVRALGVLSRGL